VEDALEDWIRFPADMDELRLRQRTLQRRWLAGRGDLWLDEHGLVHREDLWVALPEAQAAVAAPLIANLGHVVRREEVRRAYEAAVGERPENAFTGLLGRLQPKLAELGVVLHRLSGGRLLLELCSSPTRARAET
jgi:DNA-binding response OmpR family regulator